MNDILRWWRTLCLNYELVRDEPEKPWRKKNINLKFSRLLTAFGTIMPMISLPIKNEEEIKALIKRTPMERFAYGLDGLNDDSNVEEFIRFLDEYEEFLALKEKIGDDSVLTDKDIDIKSREIANSFSNFIRKMLQHRNIDESLKKYLVL